MTSALPQDARLLAAMFAGSGVLHLVRPQTFEPLMPQFVPAHREVVVGSGVVELACAAGLLHPRTRRVAGYASAGLLGSFYVAHLKQTRDAVRGSSRPMQVAALARLPLQVPLIRAALKAARTAPPRG